MESEILHFVESMHTLVYELMKRMYVWSIYIVPPIMYLLPKYIIIIIIITT